MTAFATKLSSATFNTALKGLRLPSRRKLVAEYLLGVSQAESIKNRADPASPLTVQGVPTYNANSVLVRSSLTVGYGFKSGLIPSEDATLIVVRKPSTTGGAQPMVAGCYDALGAVYGMGENGANNYAHNGETTNTGASRTKPAAATIYFEAVTLSKRNPQLVTGGLGTLYYYAAGVQTTVASAVTNNANRREMTQLCIGSDSLTDSITTNTIEVYFVALYQRTLTAAEIDAAYLAIVAYYAALGITVV